MEFRDRIAGRVVGRGRSLELVLPDWGDVEAWEVRRGRVVVVAAQRMWESSRKRIRRQVLVLLRLLGLMSDLFVDHRRGAG